MIESIVKIIAIQTAITEGVDKASKWFEKKAVEEEEKEHDDALEMNRLFDWLQDASGDKPSTSPIDAGTYPALAGISTVLDNVTPDIEESNPMTGFSNEMFEGNITFADVITHQKIDELGEFNFLMSSITHEKMDDIIRLLEGDEQRDKRARREKNEASRDNMLAVGGGGGAGMMSSASMAAGIGGALALLGLPLLGSQGGEKPGEKPKDDKKDDKKDDGDGGLVDTFVDMATSVPALVIAGSGGTWVAAKKYFTKATDEVVHFADDAGRALSNAPALSSTIASQADEIVKPISNIAKYAKWGFRGVTVAAKAVTLPVALAAETAINAGYDYTQEGKPMSAALVDGAINTGKEMVWLALKGLDWGSALTNWASFGVLGSKDLIDDESPMMKALEERSNVFDIDNVQDKVSAKYGDDVEAREAGEKRWDEAENKYDAVDIGGGFGQIENEKNLAELSIEHLEALLTHQNWKKKDEELITKILMAKQQKTEIDTAEFSDWNPFTNELKFDSGFEATYQKWYADKEAENKIEAEKVKKERSEERKSIITSSMEHFDWRMMLGPLGYMHMMTAPEKDVDPAGVSMDAEYQKAFNALPVPDDVSQDDTVNELDQGRVSSDASIAGTLNDAHKAVAIEEMSAAEIELRTEMGVIQDRMIKSKGWFNNVYEGSDKEGRANDQIKLDELLEQLNLLKQTLPKDWILERDTEGTLRILLNPQPQLKQHGDDMSDINQLTTVPVPGGQDSGTAYVDSSTVTNITNQGDMYAGNTTAHAPNLPHGNGGSVVYI